MNLKILFIFNNKISELLFFERLSIHNIWVDSEKRKCLPYVYPDRS